jgi:flagellar protein FliS
MTHHDHHHNAYKAAAWREENKTLQVVMLYEGVLRYARQAREAIEKGDIEARYNSLTRACEIINGLQLSLDFAQGGEVAQLLYDYYAGLDQRLSHLHFHQDISLCDLCIRHLTLMRDAWQDVHAHAAEKEATAQAGEQLIQKKLETFVAEAAVPGYAVLPELSGISVSA